eukprot:15459248-Alexandrium_andersonii.AAC.1
MPSKQLFEDKSQGMGDLQSNSSWSWGSQGLFTTLSGHPGRVSSPPSDSAREAAQNARNESFGLEFEAAWGGLATDRAAEQPSHFWGARLWTNLRHRFG